MNINGKIVGKELLALRKKKSITLENLSKEIGIHTNTLSKYEKDASDMKLSTLQKILKYYNVDEIIFFNVICEYNHKNNN